MKCEHCGARIIPKANEWIRICPYCKSILDNHDFKFPTHDKKGIHVDLCVPDAELVRIRGKKTKFQASYPRFVDFFCGGGMIAMGLLILGFAIFFLYMWIEQGFDMPCAGLCLLFTAGTVFWTWLSIYCYRYSYIFEFHYGLNWPKIIYAPMRTPSHIIALFSNDDSLVWYITTTTCNSGKLEDIKTAKNEVFKQDVLLYQWVDDKCGGMYAFYGANNKEIVRIPAIYTEAQIQQLLPYSKKMI